MPYDYNSFKPSDTARKIYLSIAAELGHLLSYQDIGRIVDIVMNNLERDTEKVERVYITPHPSIEPGVITKLLEKKDKSDPDLSSMPYI